MVGATIRIRTALRVEVVKAATPAAEVVARAIVLQWDDTLR